MDLFRLETNTSIFSELIEEEIWKPVPSKEGIMASSLGRIKLPERLCPTNNGGFRKTKTKPTYGYITRASKNASHVYYGKHNKFYGNLKIHRLICEAFHGPQPTKDSVVIHIDENALNNNYKNLRWGTQKENLNSPKFLAYCKTRTGENNPHIKGISKKLNGK